MADGPHEPPLPPFVDDLGHDCVLAVRVVPRAGRTGLAGERAGALLVRLAAAPVDGAANDALLAYLADCLKMARRALALVAGERSRDKRIRVTGLSGREAAQRLRYGRASV